MGSLSSESPWRGDNRETEKASMRNYQHWIHGPLASVTLVILSILLLTLARTGVTFAEDRRFYVGVTVPVERLDASYEKTVDNTHPDNRVPEPRRGMVFHDEDSDDTFAYGIGLLAGYHLPLTESGFYLSGEVDVAFHGGQTKGQLRGVGTSAGRNQPGESWPDRWSFEKDQSYGFTLKLGGSPGVLRSWDTSLYVLGGIRLIQAQFTNHYNGCLLPKTCSVDEFASGTASRDLDFTAWTYGIGVEKMLGEQLALRIETRYTLYDREQWVEWFDDVGVSVPTRVDPDDVGLLLSMAWYF